LHVLIHLNSTNVKILMYMQYITDIYQITNYKNDVQ